MAYSIHNKAFCGRHRYHSGSVSGSYTMRTKLTEGLSHFDKEVGKIFAPPLTLIVHAIFLTDSFFSRLLFESVIV